MKKYCINVNDITCASCTNAIESYLKEVLGEKLHRFSSNIAQGTITVQVSKGVSKEEISDAIEEVGYEVGKNKLSSLAPFIFRAALAGIAGIVLLILSFTGLVIPLAGLITIALITLPIMIYSGFKIFKDAWKAFKTARSFTMDSLFSISAILVYVFSILSIAMPSLGLPIFFSAALLIFAFRNIGIAIEKKSKRALMKNRNFVDRTPNEITTVESDLNCLVPKTKMTLVKNINIDDVIKVTSGQIIPLDGVIIKGSASVLQTIWSGDAYPKRVQTDQHVYAGMEVTEGNLYICVKKNKKHSLLARIDKQMAEAQECKPNIEKITTSVIKFFVPTVVVIAILSAIFVSLFFSPIAAVNTGISVLCVACPCVFGWLVPLTTQVAMTKAAMHNAHFTKASAMENMSKIDTIVFDKTGTLTEPTIKDVVSVDNNYSEKDIISLASSLEDNCDHIIANAVIEFARRKKTSSAKNMIKIETLYQLGRSGSIENDFYLLGCQRLMQKENIDISRYKKDIRKYQESGMSVLFLAVNKEVIGLITLEQRIKNDAKLALNALRNQGVKRIKICTGSDKKSSLSLAAELDINEDDVVSEQNPQEKLLYIRKLQLGLNQDKPLPERIQALDDINHKSDEELLELKSLLKKHRRHIVAYVGDAGNDAIAMSGSDVSFAMSSGDKICKINADIILPNHSFKPLLKCLMLSKQTMKNITLNLAVTIVFNLIMISIAAGALIPLGFTLSPAIAAGFMIVQALVVLFSVSCFKGQRLNAGEIENTKNDVFWPAENDLATSDDFASEISLKCTSNNEQYPGDNNNNNNNNAVISPDSRI